VPIEMQVDLMEHMTGHEVPPQVQMPEGKKEAG
jgi:hypothetical protein